MAVLEKRVKVAGPAKARTRARFRLVVALGTVLLGVASGPADRGFAQEVAKPTEHRGKTVRLLTVGNSFSVNATHFLGDLVKAAGHKLVYRAANIGGGSMAQHWDKVLRYEKDPQDKQARYGKNSLNEMLLAEKFDVVTIQQYSFISHDVSTYRPYAQNLCGFIKKHAPQAEVLVHQTWAYRCDDPRFAKKPAKPGQPATQEEMYQGLTRAYDKIAAELGLRVIPVGDAFHLADTDPTWGYKPGSAVEPSQMAYPALPDQLHSLHSGWRWSKDKLGKPVLQMDGHHAGLAGEYLGACVFYEILFSETIVGNKFVPKGLDEAYARFLRQTAHKAVEARRQVAKRP
jgi:hypothetical protein